MPKQYPSDYAGPQAGISSQEEWFKITEYEAFKHIKFKDWTYADFDCWLSSRDAWHYSRGRDDAIAALKEFHNIWKK